MPLPKINPWLTGITLIFAGVLVHYYEAYHNNQIFDFIDFSLILSGWVVLFIRLTKGTNIGKNTIKFGEDKAGWFKQGTVNLVCYLVLAGAFMGTIFIANHLAQTRKTDILDNQPTATTVAVVDHIEVRRGRNSTSYYAVFQYTVNGRLVSHPWHEGDKSEFTEGDRYQIFYSIRYPEMMRLQYKLNP